MSWRLASARFWLIITKVERKNETGHILHSAPLASRETIIVSRPKG
jgi:hypothetical protein